MKSFYNILGATKFEVHLQIFSDVSTRAGRAVTIYLGITKEASQIFYSLKLLLQALLYSLFILLQ